MAILPTFGKIFESMICNSLTDKFHDVTSKSQHGFVKKSSTVSNLVECVSNAAKVMESGGQINVICTDFKNALDRVKHWIVIRTLNAIGVHSSVLEWIQSQCVNLYGWNSRSFIVTSLFILFINDSFTWTSTYFIYANDLKVCRRIYTARDAIVLHHDLNNLILSCDANQLHLNVGKRSVISFAWKRSSLNLDARLKTFHCNE